MIRLALITAAIWAVCLTLMWSLPSIAARTDQLLVHGHTAAYWWHQAVVWRARRARLERYADRTARLQAGRIRGLRKAWRPTVLHAIRLASITYGLPYGDLKGIAWCESRWTPSENDGPSGPWGLFQFEASTWARTPFAGFSPFDAVANALAAGWLMRRDGSYREWQCKPDGSLRW